MNRVSHSILEIYVFAKINSCITEIPIPAYIAVIFSNRNPFTKEYRLPAIDGCSFAYGADDGDGVFAWVHSRNDYDKTKVSTQYLIDNNSMLAAYKTDDAFTKACKSYGSSADVFLTPDDNGSVAPVAPAVPDVLPTDGKFEVKLIANPSIGGSVTGAGRYPAGQSVEISASPAEGYQFNRWSDGNTNASRSVTLNSNTTLTAYFKSDSDTGDQNPSGSLEG